MRDLVVKYLSKGVFAPQFRDRPDQGGPDHDGRPIGAELGEHGHSGADCPAAGPVKTFEGHGGAAFAEQLIASGVKYVFGNSASEDAQFYEALVDARSSNTSSPRTKGPAPPWRPAM